MLSSDGGSTFQTTLTIPSSATLGIHRIRVRLNYNQALNPCTPYNFGETEDYSINIKMPITYPSVLTLQISNIKSTTATSGGNIIFDGYSDIIARGVCWNTTGNPTILDSKTSETPNVGIYDSYITGLEQNQTFYVRAYATNKLGTAYGSELEGKTTNDETFRIPLNSGWNLISSKLIPKEPDSINHITNLIHNNLIIAKNSQGNVYIPQFSINTIGKWNITQGYLFFLNATDTLDIEGTIPVPSENPIGLVAGWNIVSYLRNSPMNSVTALASISDNGNLIIAKNLSGQVYIPAFGINTIGNLIPGQGYYIFVNNADTLIYPNN